MKSLSLKLLSAMVIGLFSHSTLAAPTGGSVVSGSASIVTSGSTTTITNTPKAIINWDSFGIGASELVRFNQQSATSAVLNRVTGNDPSRLLGTLQSNGQVFLVNPNGIMFGANSRIDVNGFVASTLDISNSDFISGSLRFNADRATPGSVNNSGSIETPSGGFVYLIAPNVENSGVISTPSGEAILVAGNSVELVDSTDPDLRVQVSATSQDVNISELVRQNQGKIFSVLNSGRVSANTVTVDASGQIFFKSAGAIQTTVSSRVEAKGNQDIDGGKFIGFAEKNGRYSGSFDVSGKNGGFVETSSRHDLKIDSVRVNAMALDTEGKRGTWLLDPTNICLVTSGATCSQAGFDTIYTRDSIASLLSNNADVILQADEDIYIDGVFEYHNPNTLPNGVFLNSSGSLTLRAGADITMAPGSRLDLNNINNYDGQVTPLYFNVALDAGGDISIMPGAGANGMAAIEANSISLTAGSNIYLSGELNVFGLSPTGQKSIDISAGNNVQIDAPILILGRDRVAVNVDAGQDIIVNSSIKACLGSECIDEENNPVVLESIALFGYDNSHFYLDLESGGSIAVNSANVTLTGNNISVTNAGSILLDDQINEGVISNAYLTLDAVVGINMNQDAQITANADLFMGEALIRFDSETYNSIRYFPENVNAFGASTSFLLVQPSAPEEPPEEIDTYDENVVLISTPGGDVVAIDTTDPVQQEEAQARLNDIIDERAENEEEAEEFKSAISVKTIVEFDLSLDEAEAAAKESTSMAGQEVVAQSAETDKALGDTRDVSTAATAGQQDRQDEEETGSNQCNA